MLSSIIDKTYYYDTYFKSTVWLTLDIMINYGLHFDDIDNIIHVLDGKKIIYLFHPDSRPNLYITNHQYILIGE